MRTRMIILTMLMAAFMMPFASCGENDVPPQQEQPVTPESPDEPENPDTPSNGKVLVAYFSRANHVPEGTDAVSGATNKARNTQTVAMELARRRTV